MGVKIKELVKPGEFYIVVRYGGRKKVKLVGSKEEAESKAAEIETALKLYGADAWRLIDGDAHDQSKNETAAAPTLKDYGERWLAQIKDAVKPSTHECYRSNLENYIIPELGNRKLDELNKGTIKDFIAKIRRRKTRRGGEFSRDSIRLMIASLRAVLSEAIDDGFIAVNPVRRVQKFFKKAPVMRSEIEPFTLEQMHQIENGFLQQFPEHYPFVLTLNRTGARIGEVIALENDDVDFQNGFLSINKNMPVGIREDESDTPKTESSNRDIQMSPQLAEAIQKHLEKRGKSSRFLFTNSAGGPVDYSNFSKKWRKVQEDLGIRPPRSPHNTRHTFATLMISRGENIAFVSKILGHSSIKVTVDTYFKWIPKANRIAVEALDFTGQLPVQNGNEAAMEEKQQNKGKRKSLKRKSEPWRNRTSNLLIKSQLLCQLS
jgi:integrase